TILQEYAVTLNMCSCTITHINAIALFGYLGEGSIRHLDWFPRNSDLNPIENVWVTIKKHVSTRNPPPDNHVKLERAVKEDRERMPIEVTPLLKEGIPRRFQTVTQATLQKKAPPILNSTANHIRRSKQRINSPETLLHPFPLRPGYLMVECVVIRMEVSTKDCLEARASKEYPMSPCTIIHSSEVVMVFLSERQVLDVKLILQGGNRSVQEATVEF
ncbi:hypothetical protein J6590_034989, partial [Homalodisca vitripennis]